MNFNLSITIMTIISLSILGCAKIKEFPRILWGSSTKALDEARHRGVSKNYNCNIELCFEDVLELAKKEGLEIYIKDHKRWLIVVMGLKDSIETTEVGLFFSAIGSKETKIEVVSLSDSAQKTAATMFFKGLDKIYSEQQ